MAVVIGGKRLWLWRAVDSEGEVLDILVQARRDRAAAVRLMRKLLRKQGFAPEVLVTDRLGDSQIFCARGRLSLPGEPLAEDNGELGPGFEPFARRPFPFLGRVVQDQV